MQKYRILREGPFATRQRTIDVYPPTTQIVRVGTGDKALDDGDTQSVHPPEYTADEYLTVTQGPGILSKNVDRDTPGGPMIEQRTPGKTGRAGWMEEAGFPTFHPSGNDAPNDDADRSKRNAADRTDRKSDKPSGKTSTKESSKTKGKEGKEGKSKESKGNKK